MEDSMKDSITSHWKHKMNFSVGEATANLAKNLLDLDTRGKEAGSSEKLCNIILGSDPVTKPFLFPCSNIRKDTIPEVLKQNGISVQEIISYETVGNPDLRSCWQEIVSQQGLPKVLVFFSPSGVQWSHQLIKDSKEDLKFFKFVAIGPSTEKALCDVGMIPCEVAKKPNAIAICEAVKNVMKF
ncbi:uroporphyrinogen-III synthase-like isoform X1 [Uloborus diversus]|nr:uroporphyrinogen-III synthase-like isoform X1 [Uloborus diversus]